MNLENYRAEIDKIDDEILELFKRRMAVAENIVKYKIENNLPVLNPRRERVILDRVCSACGEDIRDYVKTLYTALFEISRTYQDTFIN